jgi:hypothetical protein
MCFEWEVAPFTGAWIETWADYILRDGKGTPHPSRVRGLKLSGFSCDPGDLPSHPSRVRGLKQNVRIRSFGPSPGRTLHGCVD